jgi:hypothetical protein
MVKKMVLAILLLAAAGIALVKLFPAPAPPHPHAIKAQLNVKLPALKFSNKSNKE